MQSTMRALRTHEWGPPENLQLETVPRPVPGPGEVLIRVHAAALNFPDLLLLAGKYQSKPPLPFTPGLEVAGVVESAEPGSPFSRGQRVLAQVDMGGFAEFVSVPASAVHSIPGSMSYEEASAFALVYQTSYFALVVRGQLKPGETVLIHSAAGGVGLAALQLARALGAGRVIGTAGSDEKLDLIRKEGADLALNYQSSDFAEMVKQETGGRGADLIFDPVGGAVGERSAKCIAFEGRIVVVGFTSGQFSSFISNHILLKNYSVVGLHWGVYRKQNPGLITEAWKQLFALYDSGRIKPRVGAVFPMDRAADALHWLASRQAHGKIVLAVDPSVRPHLPAERNPAPKPAPAASPSKSSAALAFYRGQAGKETGVSDWMRIDQDRINQFADATLDHQFIHIDAARAAEISPFKTTIAHGFLTLSLVPHFFEEVAKKATVAPGQPKMLLNYGLDRVRFPSPVKVGSRVRARVELISVEEKAPDVLQLKQKVTIEIDGESKPACVAEMLARVIY